MVAAALAYAEMGMAVFPCGHDKAPLTPHGYKDASNDAEQLRSWWTDWPSANIAYWPDGMLVVDLDPHKLASFDPAYAGYDDSTWDTSYGPDAIDTFFGRLGEQGREACLSSPIAQSPRGGLHIYLSDSDRQFSCTTGRLAAGIDTRAGNGYILLPPSKAKYVCRDRGTVWGTYRWLSEPGQTKPKKAPQCLIDWYQSAKGRPTSSRVRPVNTDLKKGTDRSNPPACVQARAGTRKDLVALDRECAAVRTAPHGTRNDTLNRAAFSIGTLVGARRLDARHAVLELYEAAIACGLPHHEAVGTIRSGLAAGVARPRTTQ